MKNWIALAALLSLGPVELPAQSAAAKSLPPPGISISENDERELKSALEKFDSDLRALKSTAAPAALRLLPEVEIYGKAVRYAVDYHEFFRSNEVGIARTLLKLGSQRAQQLREGHPAWPEATGLVVRAYLSKIDGSVQPYGLVVPPGVAVNPRQPRRLDCWFHGRDETLTELKFIDQRQKSVGEFSPPDTLVLHLYGRYCNASKFAGEVDLFEAVDDVRQKYAIDPNRIAVRGFSMGGATVWHIATHFAGHWAAASPGAGFAETAEYMKVFKSGTPPPAYEQTLWHLYNATDYAGNLFNCPLIAYSGEIDPQKQSSEIMATAMAREGLTLNHIVGPNTAHKYEPGAKKELARQFDALVAKGRDAVPEEIRFTTWTLRYNQMKWVTIDALQHHWERAQVTARISTPSSITASTTNITAITFAFEPGSSLRAGQPVRVILDAQEVIASAPAADHSWRGQFRRSDGRWKSVEANPERGTGLAKRHGLQGPIDDAFMDSFIFVRPTGKAWNEKAGRWAEAELARAIEQWRNQFRGDARVKNDTEISEEDIAHSSLVLWGDPASNKVLGRIAAKLPLRWSAKEISLGGRQASAADHAAVLIYPNPLNPNRYVVLNSSFTFRGFGSNADQTPKLPDYALVNLNTPPNNKSPGEIITAGFFNESWSR